MQRTDHVSGLDWNNESLMLNRSWSFSLREIVSPEPKLGAATHLSHEFVDGKKCRHTARKTVYILLLSGMWLCCLLTFVLSTVLFAVFL